MRWDQAFEPLFCQKCIEYYEAMNSVGFGLRRHTHENISKLKKDGGQVFMVNTEIEAKHSAPIHNIVLDALWKTYLPQYIEKYSALENSKTLGVYNIKIQKTDVGEGYHIWHYEHEDRDTHDRVLNFQIYLNDVESGGETEFLYQHRREPAQEGSLLIYPAYFTHTHRGNPPLTNAKYLLVGWIEF